MNQKLIVLILLLLNLSCKSGLEKEYGKSTKEKDLKEISLIISKEESELLKNYIIEQEEVTGDLWKLKDESYDSILSFAKRDVIYKKERLKERLKEKIRKEKAEKELLKLRKSLLCNKKWKIYKHTYELQSVDSIYSIGESKAYEDLLNKKTWKEYFLDGTFKEKFFNGKITNGKWKIFNSNKIKETKVNIKPRISSLFTENEPDSLRVYLNIKVLNESTFAFESYRNSNYTEITIMKN